MSDEQKAREIAARWVEKNVLMGGTFMTQDIDDGFTSRAAQVTAEDISSAIKAMAKESKKLCG